MEGVNWVVSLLAGVPLAIIANLLTPKVKNWWGRRSIRLSRRRIEELENELELVSLYASSMIVLGVFLSAVILRFLVLFAVGIAAIVLPGSLEAPRLLRELSGGLGAMCFLWAIALGWDALFMLRNVQEFERYKSSQEKTLERLRANAERKGAGQ